MTMYNPELEAAYDEQDAFLRWCEDLGLDSTNDANWEAYNAR